MSEMEKWIKTTKIENNLFISFDLKSLTAYDDIACKALKVDSPSYILPVLFDREKDLTTMRYSLSEELVSVMSEKIELDIDTLFDLYEQLLTAIKTCMDYFLLPSGLCLEEKYVYVDKETNTLKFIYIPEKGRPFDEKKVKDLLVSLLSRCKESSEPYTQLRLYKYLHREDFCIDETMLVKFEALRDSVVSEQNQSLAETNRVNPLDEGTEQTDSTENEKTETDLSPIIQEEPLEEQTVEEQPVEETTEEIIEQEEEGIQDLSSYYTSQPTSEQLSPDEIEEVVQAVCKPEKENLETDRQQEDISSDDLLVSSLDEEIECYETESDQESVGESKDRVAENKEIYIPSVQEEAPVKKRRFLEGLFSGGRNSQNKKNVASVEERRAVLECVSAHGKYNLPKQIAIELKDNKFMIGRATQSGESTGADYEFSVEVTPISRLHAKIQKKDGCYYIQDVGSSNGTYLNGKKLEINKPYVLEAGDKVAFAIAYFKNSIEYVFVE